MRDDDSYDDDGSNAEVAAFKKGLAGIDRETLRNHLTQRTITRKWKRELVEAEYARRAADDPDGPPAGDAASGGMRLRTQSWGRWTAGIIIVLCCLILLYTLFEFWMM